MGRKRTALFFVVLVAAFVTFACGGASSLATAEVRSDKARITRPDVSADRVAQLASNNNAFALDLYNALRASQGGNFLFSPYSISSALAMTYAGARGTTESEIQQTLHFLTQDQLHPAFNALDLALATPSEQPIDDGEPLTFTIANSTWSQRGFDVQPAFLDVLAQYYGAGLRLVDFQKDPESARNTINNWVAGQTNEKIRDLFPKGSIDQLTRLVLANAIYFKGSWMVPFDASETSDDAFRLLNGTELQTPMMHVSGELLYGQSDGVQAVGLPYAGGTAEMVIFVPDEGRFEQFESSFDASIGLERTRVILSMPKFGFESAFSLRDALTSMGLREAFDPDVADFSGMDGKRDLFVHAVLHKAAIAVDEQGTEAAAASGVVIGPTSAPAGPVELQIDRPFLFVIRDMESGTILFAGRVLDPSA